MYLTNVCVSREYTGDEMAWISKNSPTTLAEMQNNALMVAEYWGRSAIEVKPNALYGMLGNMQAESGINPGAWQGYVVNYNRGYGVVQWTPATNFTNWATANGYEITSGEAQMKRIEYEYNAGIQYYKTSAYPLTFAQYMQSDESPEYLASAWMHNYERPNSYAQEGQRRANARYWYNYFNNIEPNPYPPNPDPTPDPPYIPGEVLPWGKILGTKPIWKMRGVE